jgi:predicted GNAT family acetyltransferase
LSIPIVKLVPMVAWRIFRHKPLPRQKITTGRFEIERSGEVAYLEYSLSETVLELIHTEVPGKLRGMGLASSLAEAALNWAREHNVKVDIICPVVQEYVAKHPEYSTLVVH